MNAILQVEMFSNYFGFFIDQMAIDDPLLTDLTNLKVVLRYVTKRIANAYWHVGLVQMLIKLTDSLNV